MGSQCQAGSGPTSPSDGPWLVLLPAEISSKPQRLERYKELIHRLPRLNRKTLAALIGHLYRSACHLPKGSPRVAPPQGTLDPTPESQAEPSAPRTVLGNAGTSETAQTFPRLSCSKGEVWD